MGGQHIRWTAATVLVALLAACGGDDDGNGESGGDADAGLEQPDAGPPVCPDSEPSASQAANNSAFLTGAALGTAEEEIDVLRKEIEVNLTAASPLQIGSAWAMRASSAQESVYLVIEISNPTADLHCLIAAEPYEWHGEGGVLIEARPRTFAFGSVAIDDPIDPATCLGQNETGYLLDISSDPLYDQLVSVDLQLVSTLEGTALPEAAIVPTGYTADGAGRIEIAFENSGTAAGTLDPEGPVRGAIVLLDAEGAAVLWNFLDRDLAPADGVVAPGATGSVAAMAPYAGCPGALRAFLAFTP